MKSYLALAVLTAALILGVSLSPFTTASGQVCEIFFVEDPASPGTFKYNGTDTLQCDTIRIGCPPARMPVIVEGDSIGIPVYLWTDEAVRGFSLGINYNNNFVEITSVKNELPFNPLRVFTNQFNYAANSVLLGFLAFDVAGDIPATAGGQGILLCTMYMRANAGVTPGTEIDLDSVFVAPAGTWELGVIGAYGRGAIRARYADCGSVDVRLPVQEYDSPVLPESFALSQNTPNPFNPSTTIDFALPKSAKVRIEVYNILGQNVKTLVDEYLPAGRKRVDWDGTDNTGRAVASGVYLYKMTAGDFSETKKMMLMK